MSFKLVKNAAGKVIAFGPGPSLGQTVEVFDEDGKLVDTRQEVIDHYDPKLPPGCTLETVDNYTPVPDPKDVALSAVTKLEAENPITHRTMRELLLAFGQVVEKVTGKAAVANPYYVKLAALNAQIDALAESIRSTP